MKAQIIAGIGVAAVMLAGPVLADEVVCCDLAGHPVAIDRDVFAELDTDGNGYVTRSEAAVHAGMVEAYQRATHHRTRGLNRDQFARFVDEGLKRRGHGTYEEMQRAARPATNAL